MSRSNSHASLALSASARAGRAAACAHAARARGAVLEAPFPPRPLQCAAFVSVFPRLLPPGPGLHPPRLAPLHGLPMADGGGGCSLV